MTLADDLLASYHALGAVIDSAVNYMATQDELIATKDQSIVSLTAQVEGLEASNATLTSDNAQLAADLKDCQDAQNPPPPPPVPLMLVGTTDGVPWDTVVLKTGPMDVRHHYEPDLPTSWIADADCAKDVQRKIVTICSVKPFGYETGGAPYKTRLKGYLSTIPTDHEVYFIVFHEPEDEIEAGRFTAAQYIKWQTDARVVIDELNVSRVKKIKLVGTLMAWSCDKGQSGRSIDTYIPPPGTWDALGWDGYDRRWALKKDSEPISSLMSHAVSTAFPTGGALENNKRLGLPFLIIETGTPEDNPERVKWENDGLRWCRDTAKGILFTYWNKDLFAKWQLDTAAEYDALGNWAKVQGGGPA